MTDHSSLAYWRRERRQVRAAAVLVVLAACGLYTTTALADFSTFRDPKLPGQRVATAVLNLKGLSINKVSVEVVFSDKEDAVRNAFDLRKRNPSTYTSRKATVKDLGNGKARCTFIFPHRDHPDGNAPRYNKPTTVHYAWAESFTPTGATEKLTINSPVRSFVMPRFLIIAYMGDSYAAGEGAPNKVGGKDEEKWDDIDCHQSQRSGGALAIEKLIEERPEWAIRYKNVTCSGAELDDFITADTRPSGIGAVGWSKPAQFEQIQTWLKKDNRTHVDILLADGGGNDVGFAPIGTSALTAFVADISKDKDVKEQVQDGLISLPGGYEAINHMIESEYYGFEVGRVVWMNYPNPLNDKTGKLCSPSTNGNNPFDCWGVLERQISDADFRYLRDTVFAGLNNEVNKAAGKYHWDLVDVSKSSTKNGLCNCDVPYFNTLGQAFSIQGDPQGTMHPNARGFRKSYRDPVFAQLERSIALWHGELAEDARADAIAIAKAQAKAKAKAMARPRAKAAVDAASARKAKPMFKQRQPILKSVKKEAAKLDPEDLKPVSKRKPDDPR